MALEKEINLSLCIDPSLKPFLNNLKSDEARYT